MEAEISFLEAVKAVTYTVIKMVKSKSLAREIYFDYMYATRAYDEALLFQQGSDRKPPTDKEFDDIIDQNFERMWAEVNNDKE